MHDMLLLLCVLFSWLPHSSNDTCPTSPAVDRGLLRPCGRSVQEVAQLVQQHLDEALGETDEVRARHQEARHVLGPARAKGDWVLGYGWRVRGGCSRAHWGLGGGVICGTTVAPRRLRGGAGAAMWRFHAKEGGHL